MTVVQIVIYIILLILFLRGLWGIFNSDGDIKTFGYICLTIMTFGMTFAAAIFMTIEVENLRKEVKSKCPEYEKLDNVYKLKQ